MIMTLARTILLSRIRFMVFHLHATRCFLLVTLGLFEMSKICTEPITARCMPVRKVSELRPPCSGVRLKFPKNSWDGEAAVSDCVVTCKIVVELWCHFVDKNPEASYHFSTLGSIVSESMFFFGGGDFGQIPKIKSVIHTGSRYFHVLFYDIKHTSYTHSWFF